MVRTYTGGDLPDYYIVDSDSHIDESQCELWRRFPEELKLFAPRKFTDSSWVGGDSTDRGPSSTRKYDNIWVIEHSKVFPNSDFRTGPFGRLSTFQTHDPDQWSDRDPLLSFGERRSDGRPESARAH